MLVFSIVVLCLKSIGVWYEWLVLQRGDKSIGAYIGQIIGKIILLIAFSIAIWNMCSLL